MDVQGAMRHSSPEQTLKIYMREIPDGVRELNDALEASSREMGSSRTRRAACSRFPAPRLRGSDLSGDERGL